MTDQTTSTPPAPAGASPGPRGARWILRLDPARRAALLLLATLLLLVPFAAARLGWPALPLAAVTLLALPALYLWGSAWAARDVPQDAVLACGEVPAGQVAAGPAQAAALAEAPRPTPPDAQNRDPDEADASQARTEPRPEPQASLRLSHAEIRLASDELARRTVALCGLLDTCVQAVDQAGADLEAMQDEERVAQKVLVTLRARLLALDHRNHALVRSALAGAAAETERAALAHAVQAAEAQVLHCHQLSERLGAAERAAVRHVESLRRTADQLARHAERGMRESQQMMVLTRRIAASLAAAEQRAVPAEAEIH